MLLGQLRAEFPWGLLLVTDASSTDAIPSWATPEEQVTSAASALVVRVRHGDEGECAVMVWNDEKEASGGLAFAGSIDVPSGILRISDALGNAITELAVEPGQHPVQIFADSAVEASTINLDLATALEP